MRDQFAKELYEVARFYQKTNKPIAAKIYYDTLIEHYPRFYLCKKNRQNRWKSWSKSFLLKGSVAFLFTSCGYRMEGNYSDAKTVSVPFVEGDVNGRLTNEIVKALIKETNYHYLPTDGDLTICVKIVDDKREYIGYKYDQEEITGETNQPFNPR